MGQPVSKNAQGAAAYPPFENYQGPPMGPGGGLVTSQLPPPGGRTVQVNDEPFWNPEPVFVPESQPMPRPPRGNFGPPSGTRGPPRGMPRRPYQPDSIVNAPGYAEALRNQMIVEAEDAPWYRSAPPPTSGPAPRREPYVKTVRTVINEPRGYVPPGQQPQQQSYQVQAQQSYQVQPQTHQYQTHQHQTQPSQVLFYDPKTGALSSSGQQYSAPTGPVGCGTQACAPQQAVGYQQPQVVGYQQPMAQPMAYAYPQPQAMTQPIVVPGQLYTADGGVQRLG